MIKAKIKHSLYIGLGLTTLLSTNVLALTFQQSLTLPVSLEYETNPRLSTTNKQSARRTTLNPAYSITATKNNEQFYANLGLRVERSSNQSASADREDPNVGLGWAHTYETGQFGITADFSERSTRTSEFDETGEVVNENTRQTRSLGGNWNAELSDRYSLSMNLDLTEVEFDSQAASLNDFDNKSIDAQLNYSVSDQVDTFARLSLSQFDPANNSTTNFRSIDLGASWILSENFSVNASGGLNETGGSNGESGWQANLDTTYTTERSRSMVGLSRSRSPSGSGVIRESNQLSADWSYSLSEKETLGMNFNYRENLGLNENETMRLSANYTRALSQKWDFRVSARHRNRDDGATDASSNSFTATIIYKLPDF